MKKLVSKSAEATASTLQEHGVALQSELRCDPASALHPSTVSTLGRSKTNAARQYKRATKRFGFEMMLACVSGMLSCWA